MEKAMMMAVSIGRPVNAAVRSPPKNSVAGAKKYRAAKNGGASRIMSFPSMDAKLKTIKTMDAESNHRPHASTRRQKKR